jgi:hypothetical protein
MEIKIHEKKNEGLGNRKTEYWHQKGNVQKIQNQKSFLSQIALLTSKTSSSRIWAPKITTPRVSNTGRALRERGLVTRFLQSIMRVTDWPFTATATRCHLVMGGRVQVTDS